MLPVIYSMSVSLDGFIAGSDGDIGWTSCSTSARRSASPARCYRQASWSGSTNPNQMDGATD